jgi:hypothetical protein
MLLACEHDRATGHFSIGAANAPSGAMAAANKLNHEMNTRAEIIFMISPKKAFADRPSMGPFPHSNVVNFAQVGDVCSCWLLTTYSGLPLPLLPGAIFILGLCIRSDRMAMQWGFDGEPNLVRTQGSRALGHGGVRPCSSFADLGRLNLRTGKGSRR